MTRINLIDPSYLSDKHLGAEYRELPRIFGLVRVAQGKGLTPEHFPIPGMYKMGKGHVTFFFNKLKWLQRRQRALIKERLKRGLVTNYSNTDDLVVGINKEWLGDWVPSRKEIKINLARINERGGLRNFHVG